MGIIETAKEAVSLVQKLDNIELIRKLVELQQQCYDLVLENNGLKEKVTSLEQALSTQRALQFRNNAYWLSDQDDEQSGPMCSTCWDAKRLTIRMVRTTPGVGHCSNCKRSIRFGPGDSSPPQGSGSRRNWVTDY